MAFSLALTDLYAESVNNFNSRNLGHGIKLENNQPTHPRGSSGTTNQQIIYTSNAEPPKKKNKIKSKRIQVESI
jgi:hypothetical protein